jgi:hypothetical protein
MCGGSGGKRWSENEKERTAGNRYPDDKTETIATVAVFGIFGKGCRHGNNCRGHGRA